MNKFLLILIILSTLACSTEKQVVKQLNKELDSTIFFITFPNELVLTNSKHYAWETRNLSTDEIHFLKFNQSTFIQYLNAEEILKGFEYLSVTEFERFGLKAVNKEDVTEFIRAKKNNSYIINVKQLEAEEYFKDWRDKEVFDDTNMYYQDFLLNALAINLWAEISKSNDKDLNFDLIFIQNESYDCTNGLFLQNIFTGEVSYSNNYDSLKLADIDILIQNSPAYFASEIIDFILNREIQKRLLAKNIFEMNYRYSYSPKKKKILPSISTPNYVLMKSSK